MEGVEEGGLPGSSAADSQLAAAMSQLRFQSAAFSSSLQTATQPLWIKTTTNKQRNKQNKNVEKHERKEDFSFFLSFFQSSDGIAQRSLSVERPLSPTVGLGKDGGD